MSDYDQRQYNVMLGLLEDLSASIQSQSSSKIVGNLEALARLLEERDEHWQTSFYEYWGYLEEITALAVVESREVFSEEENILVVKSVTSLRGLIEQKIDKAA